MSGTVIIYGKGGCPYTDEARAAYGDRATYYDVKRDPKRLEEMLVFSGGRYSVPVIVEGQKVTVGYGGS